MRLNVQKPIQVNVSIYCPMTSSLILSIRELSKLRPFERNSKNYPPLMITFITLETDTRFITGHKSPWSVSLESLLQKVPERQKNNTVLPPHCTDLHATEIGSTGKVLYINTPLFRKSSETWWKAWPKIAVSNTVSSSYHPAFINKYLDGISERTHHQ